MFLNHFNVFYILHHVAVLFINFTMLLLTIFYNTARYKKELEMNFGSEKARIEIEADTNLNNTHKWSTEMKVNLLKIEERKRN